MTKDKCVVLELAPLRGEKKIKPASPKKQDLGTT